jgi:hypothetical protein
VLKWIFNSCFAYLLLFHPVLYGQAPRDVPFYATDAGNIREQLADQTAASILAKFHEPEQFDKPAKKAYAAERERMQLKTTEEIRKRAVTDDVLWPFLKNKLQTIIAANPQASGTRVILVANPTPNAYSVGDGTIIVYTGLLAGLEHEDQIVFVLCHEISHYLLQHSTRGLVRHIQTLYGKEFRDKVKAVDAEEFNKNEHLERILKTVFFNSRYHSRDFERQADSLAYRLYTKTTCVPEQVRRMMQVFEFIDEPLRDTVIHLDTQFGCGQYPFQPQWLSKRAGSVWADAKARRIAAEKPELDSMSTHPDWKNRLIWIDEMSGKTPGTPSSPAASTAYAQIQYLSVLETVEAWFDHERFDRSLYYALLYGRQYPSCAYLKAMKSLSINGLYTHSLEHKLATVLSQPSPDFPEKYNAYLSFLNNLRLKNFLGLQQCGMQDLASDHSEYGLLAAYQLAEARTDKAGMLRAKTEYLQQYRKGRFAEFFKSE